MTIQYTFHNIPEELKENFKIWAEKKLKRVEKLLKNLPDDAVKCLINSEYFEKHNAFKTGLNLEIPGKTLHTVEDSHDVFKTIDLAFDTIITQLKKKKEMKK